MVLDPMAEMVSPIFATMMAFVALDRQSFVDCHIGLERTPNPVTRVIWAEAPDRS